MPSFLLFSCSSLAQPFTNSSRPTHVASSFSFILQDCFCLQLTLLIPTSQQFPTKALSKQVPSRRGTDSLSLPLTKRSVIKAAFAWSYSLSNPNLRSFKSRSTRSSSLTFLILSTFRLHSLPLLSICPLLLLPLSSFFYLYILHFQRPKNSIDSKHKSQTRRRKIFLSFHSRLFFLSASITLQSRPSISPNRVSIPTQTRFQVAPFIVDNLESLHLSLDVIAIIRRQKW